MTALATAPSPAPLQLTAPPVVVRVAAALHYDEPVARLVLAAKSGERFDLLAVLARWLPVFNDTTYDAVTWIPASKPGRRQRGYDQGRELARALARRLDLPLRSTLVRVGASRQRGRGRHARLAGPALQPRRHGAASLLIVDDVFTTGGSLASASRALVAGGARRVDATVVATVGYYGG